MSPSGFYSGNNGWYNETGTLKINGTELKAISGGLQITGSLQLGASGTTGALVAYGSVASIIDGDTMNLT